MGVLIFTIGFIPIVLAVSMQSLYKESKLSRILGFYMLLITAWQFDIGVLFLGKVLSKETILVLFKFLRGGTTFSIPVVYYIAFSIIKGQPALLAGRKWLDKLSNVLLNKKVLYFLIFWSTVIYFINWTSLGTKGLYMANKNGANTLFLFPEYGPLIWLYILHMGSFLLFLILIFMMTKGMVNQNIKRFLARFSLYSLLLYIFGFLNFSPGTGGISSSIGVIIFSTLIVMEFIKLGANIKANYYEIMERQMKLDYTGNLAGSLIHEVKNANQIIKGFSQMLNASAGMDKKDKAYLNMIEKTSEHLDDLVDNYKTYLKSSSTTFKKENLESIIRESLAFSQAILTKHQIEVELLNCYHSLDAYVNKANLKQVFINLIKNSIEAIPEDRKDKRIAIRIEVDQEMIMIHFKDTGTGIGREHWESVFNPFLSLKPEGMGLGLPYVKKIIIGHLGNIRIVESSAEGTHFQIEIPQNGILNMD